MCDKSRENRKNIWIDLVLVIAEAVPDPEQPKDGLTIRIPAIVYNDFCQDVASIDERRNPIQEAIHMTTEDIFQATMNTTPASIHRRDSNTTLILPG